MSYFFVGQQGLTGAPVSGSNANFTGTLVVGGASTLAAVAATTLNTSGLATLASAAVTAGLTVGTTLGVTGTSTLAGVNAGATATTTLSSSGLATLNSASVTTTLGVSGVTTLGAALQSSIAAPLFNATAATTYLQTFQDNGTSRGSIDKGGNLVPTNVNPSTYYMVDDWDLDASTADYTQAGNVVIAAVNSVSAPLMAASTQGVAYVNTSSTTAGGRVARPAAYGIVKSTTINYRWRHIFYVPVASTAANTYTAFIGSFVATGSANAADIPFAGPYISYSHGANSGNWIMGSAVNNTRTTGNSATAPTLGAWNTLQVDLANGTYTFTVNGVAIGTLLDNNITTSPANGQSACLGGIMIIPDGTNFTTNRVLMIDRSDYWVAGLTR